MKCLELWKALYMLVSVFTWTTSSYECCFLTNTSDERNIIQNRHVIPSWIGEVDPIKSNITIDEIWSNLKTVVPIALFFISIIFVLLLYWKIIYKMSNFILRFYRSNQLKYWYGRTSSFRNRLKKTSKISEERNTLCKNNQNLECIEQWLNYANFYQ